MLPFFYHENLAAQAAAITLDEAVSRHCIQVLRMQAGDQLLLTDGNGSKALCSIAVADRKHCSVKVLSMEHITRSKPAFSLAIAFTKNKSRNEWLLEKVTELGVYQVIPVITHRSEKEKLKPERLNSILVSAMLQSQQYYLPQLSPVITLKDLIKGSRDNYKDAQKLIAHCIDDSKSNYASVLQKDKDVLMLIGPEGDFTEEEVTLCLENDFIPVSLGHNRLRTETAGIYTCTVFNALNND